MTTDQQEFGKWRSQWIHQIRDDQTVTGDGFRVLHTFADFLNHKTRTAMPGNLVLAERAHVNIRTVQRAIAWAAKQGHLTIIEAKGRWPRILAPVLGVTNCRVEGVTNISRSASKINKVASGHL
jgi:hypothetical protein